MDERDYVHRLAEDYHNWEPYVHNYDCEVWRVVGVGVETYHFAKWKLNDKIWTEMLGAGVSLADIPAFLCDEHVPHPPVYPPVYPELAALHELQEALRGTS